MFLVNKQLASKEVSFLPKEVDNIIVMKVKKINVKDRWFVGILVDWNIEVTRLSKMIEEHCNRVIFLESELGRTTKERRQQESQDVECIKK